VPLSVSAHHFIIENYVILIIGTSYRHETALFALNVAELRRGGNKGGGMRHCQWTKAFVCSKRETMRFTDEGLLEVLKLNGDEFVTISRWKMTFWGTYTTNEAGLPIYYEGSRPDTLDELLRSLSI
jgi:hypothetical protein